MEGHTIQVRGIFPVHMLVLLMMSTQITRTVHTPYNNLPTTESFSSSMPSSSKIIKTVTMTTWTSLMEMKRLAGIWPHSIFIEYFYRIFRDCSIFMSLVVVEELRNNCQKINASPNKDFVYKLDDPPPHKHTN